MAIYQLDDLKPALHDTAWVADSAQVMGNVTLAERHIAHDLRVVRDPGGVVKLGF